MRNLQAEKIAILRNVDGKELTKKELKELGISDYFIKVFMEDNIINRISRGNYKVSFTKKDEYTSNQKLFQFFNRFRYKVLSGKYIEAYEALMENYRLQTSHDYDNHMRIYFILLKELLGDNYDFSPLDELYEFTEEKTNTYYDYFIDFREAIMEGNFYDANIYLEKFTAEEKKFNRENNISTILFNNLLEDVLKKIEDSYNTQVNHDVFNENNRKLVGAIISQDYKNALKYVESCIFSSKNEKMTLNMKRIRTILNDIVAIKEDNVNIKSSRIDYSKTNSVYSKFVWALGAKDYYKAQEILEEIMEVNDRGIYRTMKRLIDAVINAMRDKNAKSKEIKNEENLVDLDTFTKLNSPIDSLTAYKIFLREYEAGNYENALYHLEISTLKNKNEAYRKNNQKLRDLLKELIDMEKNKRGFVEVDIEYPDSNNISILFNRALENRDYKTAFRNSGKISYQSNSKILALFKDLLHRMYDLDKKYGSVKSNNNEQENVVEKQEKNMFNEEILTNYVNEGRYDELFVLLKEKNKTKSLNRLEHTVFKLLKTYNSVVNGYYEVPEHIYTMNERDYLGRFFEAIRCEDIYTAYGEIASIYGNVQNPHEFDIFEIILKDIIDKKEEIEEEKENTKISEEILDEISDIIKGKKYLSSDDIERLYNCIADLQNISNKEIAYIISGILEFIELANNDEIDATYLADLNDKAILSKGEESYFYSSNKPNDTMFYLQNGDYINALRYIKSLDNKTFSYQERNIIKTLLIILNNTLTKERKYNIDHEEIPEKHLENLKRIIKKYDFYAAFYYVIDHNLSGDYLEEIFPIIFDEMVKQLIMQEDLYKEFNQAIEEERRDDARIAMINFKEGLDSSSLGNVEYSQDKYVEMQRKLQK